MQNDKHHRPARTAGTPPTDDRLAPAAGILYGLAFALTILVLVCVAAAIVSAIAWVTVALWGAIL